MAAQEKDDYVVERFTLDDENYKRAVQVVKAAYLENSPEEGGTISFTEETFNIFFGSPTIPRNYFVRVVHKPTGEMVGFEGATPRLLHVNGKNYRTGVPGMLAVHPQHQRKNLALRIGAMMLKMGKELGYEGGFGFFEPEAHGIDTAAALVRETGLKGREIITIKKFIIRVFDVKKMSQVVKIKWYEKLGLALLQSVPRNKNPRVRKYKPGDAERVFELLEDHKTRNQASFIRERDDFIWFLGQPGVNCVVHEGADGKVDGFMIAWRFNIAGFGKSHPFGWLDMVHTYRLSTKEATDLCNYFAQTSRELGWVGLQTPFIPYFDPAPLKKARFVFYPKKLIVNFYPLVDVQLPDRIESFYFDWR
nr:GNAT family N-acetyltransferase [Candidatus Sigynarchaeum springense]